LARIRFSFFFAKDKAWTRWAAAAWAAGRGDDEEAAAAALAAIAGAKARIGELEQDNGEIAEQNEGLREGALEGVQALE